MPGEASTTYASFFQDPRFPKHTIQDLPTSSILNDLVMLTNHDMDSKSYAVLILNGQPVLNDILSRSIHESLRQRIVIHYHFEGISRAETEEYVLSHIKLCGISEPIFNKNSFEASIPAVMDLQEN